MANSQASPWGCFAAAFFIAVHISCKSCNSFLELIMLLSRGLNNGLNDLWFQCPVPSLVKPKVLPLKPDCGIPSSCCHCPHSQWGKTLMSQLT